MQRELVVCVDARLKIVYLSFCYGVFFEWGETTIFPGSLFPNEVNINVHCIVLTEDRAVNLLFFNLNFTNNTDTHQREEF